MSYNYVNSKERVTRCKRWGAKLMIFIFIYPINCGQKNKSEFSWIIHRYIQAVFSQLKNRQGIDNLKAYRGIEWYSR